MNRENKRKTFEKGYYKTHACNDPFTCKVCGRVCTPAKCRERPPHPSWNNRAFCAIFFTGKGVRT